MLQAEQLSWAASGCPIVQNVSLRVAPGRVHGIVGPNGSGKSSLLKLLVRLHKPTAGRVRLEGQDIWHMDARRFAQQVAVMGQDSAAAFDGSVRETVMLGRMPHQSRWAATTDTDRAVLAQCLAQVGATHLANARLSVLSGGERQRVLLARALAQGPQLLVLDEPTNHLDIRYQLELMRLVTGLGLTVVVVLHDLNIAAQFCDRIALMAAGHVVAEGAPADVLTAERIEAVFGVRAEVDRHPANGRLRIAWWGGA